MRATLDLEDPSYKEMKTTLGGVMLLVRLHADLSVMPYSRLRQLTSLPKLERPETMFLEGTRLRTTYEWLDRKFGKTNAVRAVVETSTQILDSIDASQASTG